MVTYGQCKCGLTQVPVCVRGKGDYFRLGHGSDAHVRKPQVADSLKSRKIVDVAVGALHCLAVTDTGQVCRVTGVSLVGHIVSVCVSL